MEFLRSYFQGFNFHMIDANIAIIPAPTIAMEIIIGSVDCAIPGVVGGCISNRT